MNLILICLPHQTFTYLKPIIIVFLVCHNFINILFIIIFYIYHLNTYERLFCYTTYVIGPDSFKII